MNCPCGSFTCPCRDNCFCTERYCLCKSCNAIRGNLCCICGLPTYHQTFVNVGDIQTRCCACFLSQSEVSQFGRNGTHCESKNAKQSRAASKYRKVRSRDVPLPTASLDSSSRNRPYRSSYESQSLLTSKCSNTAEISHRRSAGYSQEKETAKHLPVISLKETKLVIEQGYGESARNQSLQAATGFKDFHLNSPEIECDRAQLISELSSLTASSADTQPQTRHRKRQITRRKSKKCSAEATKHKLTSTSESSDCPPLNVSRKFVESSSYISPTGPTASTVRAPYSGTYQAQAQSGVPTPQGGKSINTMHFAPTTYGPPIRMPLEYGPPPFPSSMTPPSQLNYLGPMPSSTTSSESAGTPKTPPREMHRHKMRTLPLRPQSLPTSLEPHFRDRSNIRNWIDTTQAATSQPPISRESEYVESANLSHANAEKGNYGAASKSGHSSDIELTRRRVRQCSTDESNLYPSSIDYETYFPNRDLENYEVSGETSILTTLDTTESSDTSLDEATEHIDNNPNVVAEHSPHSSNSLEDIPHDENAN